MSIEKYQHLWGLIGSAAIMALAGGLQHTSIKEQTERWNKLDQDQIERWKLEEKNQKNYEKYSEKMKELSSIKKTLIEQMFSSPHREVSKCTRFLSAMKKQGSNLNINLDFVNYKERYDIQQKEYKLEAKVNEIIKMNDCRSLIRDNMEYIKHLLEEYSENINETKELAKSCNRDFKPNMLTTSDVPKLKKRYERFVENCKELDIAMENDMEIYDKSPFVKLLDECSNTTKK